MYTFVKFLLVIISVSTFGNSNVSCQSTSPAIVSIQTTLRDYNISSLNSLSLQYNALRDDVHLYFSTAHTLIKDIQNNMYGTVQRFPFHLLTDPAARDTLSVDMSIFFDLCTRPTVRYLELSSITPLFNFTANNTTPMEVAFYPVSNSINQIYSALNGVSKPCVQVQQLLRLGDTTVRPVFENFVNKIRGCIRTAFTAYRSPLSLFISTQTNAVIQLNRIIAAIQACALTFGDKNSCVINLSADFCSTPSPSMCEACGYVQSLKEQATTSVDQTQILFNTCVQNVQSESQSQITVNTQTVLDKIKSCTSRSVAMEPDEPEPVDEFFDVSDMDMVTDHIKMLN